MGIGKLNGKALLTTGVAMKKMAGCRIAYVEHRGPFDEIGFAFQRLLRSLRERRLHVAGPMIAIHPSGPPGDGGERRSAEAAVPMSQGFQEDNELRSRELPAGDVASLIYEGPPSKYGEAINSLWTWVEANECAPTGPMREIYSRDLSELPPGILYVEVQLPVRQRRRI